MSDQPALTDRNLPRWLNISRLAEAAKVRGRREPLPVAPALTVLGVSAPVKNLNSISSGGR